MASEVIGVKVVSIREYVAEGLLSVKRYELRKAWVSREDVERIKERRLAGYGWRLKSCS